MEQETKARCTFNGEKYIIVERACDTVRIKNESGEWCVAIDRIRPTNKEGRVICGKEVRGSIL